MTLNFTNIKDELKEGVKILSVRLGFNIGEDGIAVNTEQGGKGLSVSYDGKKASITYAETICFFRALGLLVENLKKEKAFELTEELQFDMGGIMLDVGATILNVNSVKDFICYMAVMGMNTLMLYTEDNYEVENEPYFGHLRGRYTMAELKELDDYAFGFGIEIIPCIQTLAHMKNFLKWKTTVKYRDTSWVMLAGSDDVYDLIDRMFKSTSEAFRSRRIHIGMDEAVDLGLGRYLSINGYVPATEILQEHLKIVNEIAKKYGYKPMMWDDMFFKLSSSTGDWYLPDKTIDKKVVENTPENVDFVYWDYYHDDVDFYVNFIRKHKNELNKIPIFAGGVWTWASTTLNYRKTMVSTNAALEACKREGVRETFATIWLNNMASAYSSLMGMQLHAEHIYNRTVDEEKFKERLEFCTGVSYDNFIKLNEMDNLPNLEVNFCEPPNPSFSLLWQDVIYGQYDKDIEGFETDNYYGNLAKKITDTDVSPKLYKCIFDIPQKMCEVLEIKGSVSMRMKNAYDNNDIAELKKIAQNDLPELAKRFEILSQSHIELWFEICKPFVVEVLESWYGGAISRVKTAQRRLSQYLDGNVNRLEELEYPKLSLFGEFKSMHALHWAYHHQLASPSE